MSVLLLSKVWSGSPNRLGTLLVELAIADFSNDEGVSFPLVKTVAKKCKLSERQVQYAISTLRGQDRLKVSLRRDRSSIYTLTPEGGGAESAPGKSGILHPSGEPHCVSVVNPIAPITVTEPSQVTKDLSDAASVIYESYPKKGARLKALPSIEKAIKRVQKDSGCDLESVRDAILRATKKYAIQRKREIEDGSSEDRFTPMAATWFNQGRYEDVVSAQ